MRYISLGGEGAQWKMLSTELLGIYPNELKICVYTKTCIQIFTAPLFIIAKNLEATKKSLSK